MSSLIIFLLIGAGIGAILGGFGQGSNSSGPLTGWQRSSIFGAVLGVGFYIISGQVSPYQHPKNVKEIAAADFETEVVRAGKPVVVDFYATWCGPCKTLAPRLDKLAGEFGDRIKFVSVDLDQAQELAQKLNVQGVPTLFFFRPDGKLVDTSVGLLPADALRTKLELILKK